MSLLRYYYDPKEEQKEVVIAEDDGQKEIVLYIEEDEEADAPEEYEAIFQNWEIYGGIIAIVSIVIFSLI